MNANDYRENGFVDMRAYLAQFGADDEAPQQMREHTRVLELEAENVRLRETLEGVSACVSDALRVGQRDSLNPNLTVMYHNKLDYVAKLAQKALGR